MVCRNFLLLVIHVMEMNLKVKCFSFSFLDTYLFFTIKRKYLNFKQFLTYKKLKINFNQFI